MRIVVQRVKSASLSVDNELINEISTGLLVFAGVCVGDTKEQVLKTARKIARILPLSPARGRTEIGLRY